jgi:hypothetical protein
MNTDEFVPVEIVDVGTKPGKAGMKAGLIGAAVLLALTLLSLIPAVGGCCSCLSILAYVGVGALAGFYLTPPRQAGQGAGAGAIAGLIAGAIGGLASSIITAVRAATMTPGDIMQQIPAWQWDQLEQYGMDPGMYEDMMRQYGSVYGYVGAGLCCLGSLAVGAALGAIGGAIYAAAKKE